MLLAPLDFMVRDQYLQARGTLDRLLELGVVPVVNENDAIADDEIRFGDNDRLAALVAHLVRADTARAAHRHRRAATPPTPGSTQTATLIEEIRADDQLLDAAVGGSGTDRGSGGMASKLAAARIASWSGVRAVIASAGRPDVLADAVRGEPGVGTVVHPATGRLSARKLWIAFAVALGRRGRRRRRGPRRPRGRRQVAAARPASSGHQRLVRRGRRPSRSPGPTASCSPRRLVSVSSATLAGIAGRQTSDLPADVPHEVVHRDDLVVLPDQP